MVNKGISYDSGILLERGRAFHFNGSPPPDIASEKYLESDNPDEAISAVLARAQNGDFGHFAKLGQLMKKSDDGVVWGRATLLYAHAAPFSALRHLLNVFEHELFAAQDTSIQGWITETLCRSGAWWAVPEVLKIFRRMTERDTYFATPRYLSFLLEPERGEIAAGPATLPRTDDLPKWFDLPSAFDDDTYAELVMSCHAELGALVSDPSRTALVEGVPLTLTIIAKNALVRVLEGEDVEEIAIARAWIEAATGLDLSEFYRDGALQKLRAAALLESLLESSTLTRFERGYRYFFGRRIPD